MKTTYIEIANCVACPCLAEKTDCVFFETEYFCNLLSENDPTDLDSHQVLTKRFPDICPLLKTNVVITTNMDITFLVVYFYDSDDEFLDEQNLLCNVGIFDAKNANDAISMAYKQCPPLVVKSSLMAIPLESCKNRWLQNIKE